MICVYIPTNYTFVSTHYQIHNAIENNTQNIDDASSLKQNMYDVAIQQQIKSSY